MKNTLLGLLFIFGIIAAQAQNDYDVHWHFGNGIGLDLSTGSPILGASNINTSTDVEPASISTNMGALLAYTDGLNVYNADGDTIANGAYLNIAEENIFAPIPGDPDHIYLFRSSISFGVSWTIIDLSANDGAGGILDEEKQQVFHPHFSQLMVTSHADMFNFWLVVADNNSGNGNLLQFTSFVIDNMGFTQSSDFSNQYVWATFFETLEEARMSPTCERIATSHKGHYVTLFNFDNSTGEISTGFDQSANSPDSFGTLNYLDFSPSGDYIYMVRDLDEVVRFDALVNDPTAFLNSEENLDITGSFTHIKRGPNGIVYLIASGGNTLAAIEGAEGEDPQMVEDVVAFDETARFFPNTVNSCQAFSAIQVTSACEGDSTFFFSSVGTLADSVYWVISADMLQDTVYSIYNFSELYPDPGVYEVTFNYLFDTLWTSLPDTYTIFAQPSVDLGPNISACAGDSIYVDAGNEAYNISWNTGADSSQILITNSGNYSVTITNGLCQAEDDMNAAFTQVPVSYMQDIVVCDTIYPVTLNATGVNIDDYAWYDGTPGPELTVEESGTYEVTLSNECFSTTDAGTVTYVIFPDNLLDSVFLVCGDDSLFLSSIYTQGNISWSNGDQGIDAIFTEEGDYTIEINHLGCETSDEFFVNYLPYVDAEELEMPNVMSYNRDDINDIFRPFIPDDRQNNICGYSTLDVDQKIYNRWGLLLEEGKCGWDGETPGGNLVPEGTYFYIVDIKSQCLDYESEKRIADHFQVFE